MYVGCDTCIPSTTDLPYLRFLQEKNRKHTYFWPNVDGKTSRIIFIHAVLHNYNQHSSSLCTFRINGYCEGLERIKTSVFWECSDTYNVFTLI